MSLLLDALKQAEANKKKAESPAEPAPMPENLSELTLEDNQTPLTADIGEQVMPQNESAAVPEKEELSGEVAVEPIVEPLASTAKAKTPPPVDVFSIGKKPVKNTGYKKIGIVLVVLLAAGVVSLFLLPEERAIDVSYKDQVAAQRRAEAKKLEVNKAAEIASAVVDDSVTVMSEPSLIESKVLPSQEVEKSKQFIELIENPGAILIKRKRTPSSVMRQLNEAYDALLGNDLSQAERIYKRVLKRQPKRIDALLGLANIESQRGFVPSARGLYEKVLRIDKTNSIAQIGLLQTYGQQDVISRQQVLEELITKYENNPEVHLALGHALGEQSKWKSAQQSYFKAFSLSPNNTVYAYNLAVSLDRMGQYQAARTYYKKALSLNEKASKPLNLERVKNRLIELGKSYE